MGDLIILPVLSQSALLGTQVDACGQQQGGAQRLDRGIAAPVPSGGQGRHRRRRRRCSAAGLGAADIFRRQRRRRRSRSVGGQQHGQQEQGVRYPPSWGRRSCWSGRSGTEGGCRVKMVRRGRASLVLRLGFLTAAATAAAAGKSRWWQQRQSLPRVRLCAACVLACAWCTPAQRLLASACLRRCASIITLPNSPPASVGGFLLARAFSKDVHRATLSPNPYLL